MAGNIIHLINEFEYNDLHLITVYVNKLNIKSVPSGSLLNNLGVDANGNVVIGTTGSTGGGAEDAAAEDTL